MYGKSVTVDGWEIWVWCCPDTPRSEVLRRATETARREEEAQKAGDSDRIAFRNSIRIAIGYAPTISGSHHAAQAVRRSREAASVAPKLRDKQKRAGDSRKDGT